VRDRSGKPSLRKTTADKTEARWQCAQPDPDIYRDG